jgi:hypothetical protein
MAMQKSEDQVPTQSEAPEKDSPLLDLSDAGVKRRHGSSRAPAKLRAPESPFHQTRLRSGIQ